MAKKRIISFLMLCVFAIVQMHNLMPHYHHEDDHTSKHVSSHHAHQEHSHHHDEKKDSHSSPFDDIEHPSDFGSAIIKAENGSMIIQKPVFEMSIVAQLYELTTLCNGPPLKYFKKEFQYFIPQQEHFYFHSVKAPPALS
jgi:hypothetical protein